MTERIKQIVKCIRSDSNRSGKALVNIIISFLVKIVSVASTILIVPMTIEYVNPTQYGIWMALSSIIGWMAFLDLGLGNGFRNKFAESVAENNTKLARQYVSTSYFALTIVSVVALSLGLVVNTLVDWTAILNIESSYRDVLQITFGIVIFFFCLNLVVNLVCMLLNADQQPGIASALSALGQLMSLVSIFLLTKYTEGNLINLALYFSGVPCLVLLLSSYFIYNHSKYKKYSPNIRFVKISLIKDILSLGIQFFIIYLCLILIFQVVNIVISRELGPESVTRYNIANKYFSMLYMVMIIIITPFWSAFTDAYKKKDYNWMRVIVKRLEYTWFICCILGLIMLVMSEPFYKIWIGDDVYIDYPVSLTMFIYVISQNLGSLYMYLINGIGTIRLQLMAYVFLALISWPVFIFSCRVWGLPGVVLMPALTYAIQAALGKIQLNKILQKKAYGIWVK